MELQCSPTAARKLWNILKLAFFMMRNGLAPKRKLMHDISLVMKRGKLLGKSLGTLMFHHHHHHHHQDQSSSTTATPDGHVYGPDEYEFSCSNTPVSVLFPAHSKRKHTCFPCVSAPPVDDLYKIPKSVVTMLPRIEYSPQCAYGLSGLAPGETGTPIPSPFSARVSNYSRAEEGEGSSSEVDHEAEEFIKRFYQQLQVQGILEDEEKNLSLNLDSRNLIISSNIYKYKQACIQIEAVTIYKVDKRIN